MPYPRASYYNPSQKYRRTWSLTPQGQTLVISGHKTHSLYADLSSAIPIFYVLMIAAILFDVYLGFAILAKSGVNLALITASVIFDLFLAILPFLLGVNISWLNKVNNENELFKLRLECMSPKSGQSDEDFRSDVAVIKNGRLKEVKSNLSKAKMIVWFAALLIFFIAGWKIFTYYSVLPPGMSIFSMVNGKIVIILSILCAVFHLIGSEKAFAHFMFKMNQSNFKEHNSTFNGTPPPKEELEINYKGNFKPAKFQNTELVVDEQHGTATIKYNHIIWDDEIKELVDRQSDEFAKRGVAITCKQSQIF